MLNTAIGTRSLNKITTGDFNTALGYNTGFSASTSSYNTFIGYDTDLSGTQYSYSTALGYNSKIIANNQVVLGTTSETVYMPGNPYWYGTVTTSNPSTGSYLYLVPQADTSFNTTSIYRNRITRYSPNNDNQYTFLRFPQYAYGIYNVNCNVNLAVDQSNTTISLYIFVYDDNAADDISTNLYSPSVISGYVTKSYNASNKDWSSGDTLSPLSMLVNYSPNTTYRNILIGVHASGSSSFTNGVTINNVDVTNISVTKIA